MNDFHSKILTIFDGLMNQNELVVGEIDEQTAILFNNKIALEVLYDRDGVKCIYYDLSSPNYRGYNLDVFLINKRRDKMSFEKYEHTLELGYLEFALNQLSENLNRAALDILAGDKSWIIQYHWPKFDMEPKLRKFLDSHLIKA